MVTPPPGVKLPRVIQRAGPDAASGLAIYLVLLFGIPARLVVDQLGAAGTPAQIFAMLVLIWWVASRIGATAEPRAPRPVRIAVLVFAGALLASYVAAATRPIEPVELRAADRGLLSLCAWVGVFLLASEGPRSHQRLDTVLRRLVLAGGVLAVIGLIQFATTRSWVELIQIPGLKANGDLAGVLSRNGFARPAGTATHPIEFGVVLAMILPVALHYALHDVDRSVLRRWFPVAVSALAIPLSGSRSAILCTVVVLLVLVPTWHAKRRWMAFGAVLVTLATVYVTVPGLLGSFRGLFLGIQSDPSAQSRTGSYDLALSYIERAPVFGRGVSTFLPEYRILDNQYLGSAIETGIVGVAALLGLLVTGVVVGRRIRRVARTMEYRDLGLSLSASIAAAGLSFATFDALGFSMVAGVTFLLLGSIACLLRLESAPAGDALAVTNISRSEQRRPQGRNQAVRHGLP